MTMKVTKKTSKNAKKSDSATNKNTDVKEKAQNPEQNAEKNTQNEQSSQTESSPQPQKPIIKTPPRLYPQTQELVGKIKNKLKDGDFMSYWISKKGSISGDDLVIFNETLKYKTKHKKLYLFIKSYGGSGETALRIVNLLRNHYKEIVALVPLDCASAATMLALGADTIKMGPLASLSAVDTSITHYLSPLDREGYEVSVSQNELERVVKLWNNNATKNDSNPYHEIYKYIHPLVIGSVDRATSLSIKLTSEILSHHIKDVKTVEKISTALNSDYPSHSYPITITEAKRIGLKAVEMECEINDLLLDLNQYYSEMAQGAFTDFDEMHYHDNEIIKILETDGTKLFYQKDRDWKYRIEEKKWGILNDESDWWKMEGEGEKVQSKKFFVK